MAAAPRLLAIAGVAAGGVLALKAVSGLESAPDFLKGGQANAAAPASAETAEPAAKAAPKPARPPANASAETFAREAGLSPAELRVLQSLGDRRTELDARERQIDTQLQLLAAAEAKLDARMKALEALKAEIDGLLGQADAREKAEVARLVKVYESMKPKDAAAVMSRLDDKVQVPVAAAMKERQLAAVLAAMRPDDAKTLTEKLAARFDAAAALKEKVQSTARATGATEPAAPAKKG
jgi:flagellar motility protein MotE (MotC chaperone)